MSLLLLGDVSRGMGTERHTVGGKATGTVPANVQSDGQVVKASSVSLTLDVLRRNEYRRTSVRAQPQAGRPPAHLAAPHLRNLLRRSLLLTSGGIVRVRLVRLVFALVLP